MKKIIVKDLRLILLCGLTVFLFGCGGGGGSGDSSSGNTSNNGTINIQFGKVSSCSQDISVTINVHVTGSGYNSGGSTDFQPILGGSWNSDAPINQSLTLATDASANFYCDGTIYRYPATNQNFVIQQTNPTVTFNIAAEAVTLPKDTQSTVFHFATPGENSGSSKWNGGALKK